MPVGVTSLQLVFNKNNPGNAGIFISGFVWQIVQIIDCEYLFVWSDHDVLRDSGVTYNRSQIYQKHKGRVGIIMQPVRWLICPGIQLLRLKFFRPRCLGTLCVLRPLYPPTDLEIRLRASSRSCFVLDSRFYK